MPVLLLARGDEDARDLLRKAIEARYGARPPAFDTLKIEFEGKVHTRIGPVKTWVPLDVVARLMLPARMRWDFTAKPAGVPIRRGVESYDGDVLRTLAGGGKPSVSEDEQAIMSLQKRLWAVAALLLTPLGDHFVQLEHDGLLSFTATNTQSEAAVKVRLLEETHWIKDVSVECLNVDKGKVQRYSLRPSTELVTFDELLLPSKISAFWDDEPAFEVRPTGAEKDPELQKTVFSLESESAMR